MMKQFKLPFPYKYAILGGFLFVIIASIRSYLRLIYWNQLNPENLQRHISVHFVNYMLWGLLVPIVYYLSKKYRIYNPASASEKFKAVLVSIILAAIHETLSNVMYLVPAHFLNIEPFSQKVLKHIITAFPSAFASRLIEYWVIYGILTAIDFQKKFRDKQVELVKKEQQLSKAQMKALKLQLQPHFLFNTLNTISSMMEFNVRDTQKVVSNLGNLLRKVLDSNKQNFTPLNDELAFTKNYLDIEQFRFNDRLNIKYSINQDILQVPVPNLLLQPLVENAIKHGFANQTGQGTIEVMAKNMDTHIQLVVKDDGKGTDLLKDELLTTGIGLKNVNDRLALIYKTDYTFEIKSEKDKGFEAIINLPKQ